MTSRTNIGTPSQNDGSVMSAKLGGSDLQTIMPAGTIHTHKQLVLEPEKGSATPPIEIGYGGVIPALPISRSLCKMKSAKISSQRSTSGVLSLGVLGATEVGVVLVGGMP